MNISWIIISWCAFLRCIAVASLYRSIHLRMPIPLTVDLLMEHSYHSKKRKRDIIATMDKARKEKFRESSQIGTQISSLTVSPIFHYKTGVSFYACHPYLLNIQAISLVSSKDFMPEWDLLEKEEHCMWHKEEPAMVCVWLNVFSIFFQIFW